MPDQGGENNMIQEFLATVDCSDPAARCGIHHLWTRFLAWLPGDLARHTKRRDFVAQLRAAGVPVGIAGSKMFAGGISLPVRPKKPRGHWAESGGKIVFHRAERIECAAGVG